MAECPTESNIPTLVPPLCNAESHSIKMESYDSGSQHIGLKGLTRLTGTTKAKCDAYKLATKLDFFYREKHELFRKTHFNTRIVGLIIEHL